MSKKELKRENQTLLYTTEALDEEIEYLRDELRMKGDRVVELISEVDRLSLRYEPYRPEGDEDESKDFYELIEEVSALKARVGRLMQENWRISEEKVESGKVKTKKFGILSLNFWPISDWVCFSYNKWDSGQYFQIRIGPLGFDWSAA